MKATPEFPDKVQLQWKNPEEIEGTTGYHIIYYQGNEATPTKIERLDDKEICSYLVEGLTPGQTYNFRVSTLSDMLESDDVPYDGVNVQIGEFKEQMNIRFYLMKGDLK